MALTRADLRGMGVTEKEIIDNIMEAHGETIETAKENAKIAAEKAAQKTIDDLQSKVDALPADDGKKSVSQEDYDKLKGEFDTYKTDISTKETTKAQDKALAQALDDAGANKDMIPLLLKEIKRENAKFDGDVDKGFTIKNSDDIILPVKTQYGGIFGETTTTGAGVATPPKSEGVATGKDAIRIAAEKAMGIKTMPTQT